MSLKTVLFGERAAGVYLKSEIYDPEFGTSPEASGKYVPAVGSLVVDDSVGLHNIVYVVTDVNQQTYKATLIPASYIVNNESQVDRVLSYGNDIFMLYFSTVTKNVEGSNINLTRLIVDNKLSLFGNHAATYQLVQTDSNGNENIISRKYKVENSNQLVPDGTSIPMLETGVDGIRKCDGCYTDVSLKEGETIRCDVYTAGGIPIAQINLIAKKAHLLNETIDRANPVVGMSINGSQQLSSGDLFLFQGQNVKELAIYVDLEYKNGESETIAIDNRRGFCYGLEFVTSSLVGAEFEILIKYYLSNNDIVDNTSTTTDSSTLEDGTLTHFLSKTAKIKIISNVTDLISKVAVIPHWNVYASKWELNFLRYRESATPDKPIYSTSDPDDPEYVEIDSETPFDGSLFNTNQTIRINHKEIINNLGDTRIKEQTFIIELKPKSNSENDFAYWLIKDDNNSPTYGDNTGAHIRPRIVFDNSISNYRIPASVFTETSNKSAVEVFLDNFYYNVNPPKYGESKAPEPTHFIIKNISGESISQNPIPIEEFTSPLNIIVPNGQDANYLLDKTVVVEFLKEINPSTTYRLFGVPVDVVVLH